MTLPQGSSLTTAGLFAGIAGIELGLEEAGHRTELFCESWEPAQAVLAEQYPEVPLSLDIRELRSLPKVDVVTAGFPCQDLSQAGRTAGIRGRQSGLIDEVFRLLRRRHPTWLVLENVRFMLQLDGGRAMRHLVDELEVMKYRWAYRVVDSRFAGRPQRRQRVFLVASRTEDPRAVLFADDAGEPAQDYWRDDAFGFYWTEGLRGLGWAQDAVPTLKGGSTIGIPSPPAVWLPSESTGRQIGTPSIDDAEALQGFPRGWTREGASVPGARKGTRWKLVGNAVTVGVARWVGLRLGDPGVYDASLRAPLSPRDGWPNAAWGEKGSAWRVDVSMWPVHEPYSHLIDLLDLPSVTPLSSRAVAGFLDRLERGSLVVGGQDFRMAVKEHAAAVA